MIKCHLFLIELSIKFQIQLYVQSVDIREDWRLEILEIYLRLNVMHVVKKQFLYFQKTKKYFVEIVGGLTFGIVKLFELNLILNKIFLNNFTSY